MVLKLMVKNIYLTVRLIPMVMVLNLKVLIVVQFLLTLQTTAACIL